MVEGRKQVSLWLRQDLKHLVENQGINLTQFVNDALEKYLGSSNEDEILRKLEEAKLSVVAFEKRLVDFRAANETEKNMDQSSDMIFREMKEYYEAHRDQDPEDKKGDVWITSPKNIKRCSMIGKKPGEILADLRKWYEDGHRY